MIRQLIFVVIFVVVLAIIPPAINADRRNPLKDPRVCGLPECENGKHKFLYKPNVRYKYEYRMHVRNEFYGSGENSSDVFVTASVYLHFPRSCEGVLSVQDIELREEELLENLNENEDENDYDMDYGNTAPNPGLHPNSEQFFNDISKNDLKFAFNDGIITELCPSEDESNWILNFKKGILSAIQNTMTRFDVDFNTTETDISGTCDVIYTLSGAIGTSLLIQKSKDISSCVNRYETKSILQTAPYDFRKKFAIWPILHSNSSCNITVDHNVYQEVSCYERHQLVPFSNQQNGAVSESHQRLTLIDEDSYESPHTSYEDDEIFIRTRTPLLYNHSPSPKPTHGEIKASRDLLKQMCKLGFPDIQRDFIESFTKFLQTARLLSYTALEQLLARAGSICTNGKNHVLESLPYISSTASIHLMKEQIIKGAVDTNIAQSWLTSFSYLPRPTEDMLEAFYNLIVYGKHQTDPMYTLPTTAVVHTFCRNSPDCGNYDQVIRILDFLGTDLNENLSKDLTNRSIRKRVLTVLKGIGNIGIESESLIDDLRWIISNESLPVDVRIEAIYAHRRLNCENSKDYFLDIYRNFNGNSELRIASYLQAMRCPDYVSIRTIKYVLTNEEVNQVGSFVWSHLTNLAKSASPVHIEAQGLLIEGDLGTKYKLDMRKFSRNFEHSLFFDEYNIGANSDINVIFGTDSYMPRSASWNFTTDLFGESINFFEISTRMEGFEHAVESIFGPKGPLNTKKFMEKFHVFTKYFRDVLSTEEYEFENTRRRKRSTEEDTEESYEFENENSDRITKNIALMNTSAAELAIRDSINNLNYDLNYEYNKPRASLGLKIFGNDIQYKSIEGFDDIDMTINKLNPYNHLKHLFSGKEITYTKSGVFLDASYDVPLGCGLPLSIHAFGASSIDLRMSGSFKANFQKECFINLEGKLKPSVSVDIIASMQSDYFYGSSGIRVKSNLYSSSAVDAKIKFNETNFASIQFNLPQDRNDIFSSRSELLVIKHDREIKQKGIAKRYSKTSCTWPFIDRAIGLKMCADYSLPDVSNSSNNYPSLILSGPINLNIYLDKADITAKTFLFEYRLDRYKESSIGSIMFHTPDSVITRMLVANITTTPNFYNLSMTFRNGEKLHSAVGTYKNTRDDKRIEVFLSLNGQRNFALEMQVTNDEIKNGWSYYPKFLLTVNNDKIAGLSGILRATSKKNVLQYGLNFNFETKRLQTNLTGYITRTEASVSTNLKFVYMFLDNPVETVEIEGELSNRSQRTRTEFLGAFKLNSTAYRQFNFASNLSFVSLLGHIEANVNFNNAPDLSDPNHTCSIRLMFARINNEDKKLEGTSTEALVEVKRPKSKVDWKFLIRYEEKTRKGFEHNGHIEIQFAPEKKATASLSILFPRSPLFAIDAMLNITVPSFESCIVSLKLIEKASKEYTIDFKGTLFTGHSMSIRGIYQDKSSIIKKYHHLKLVVKSPHFEDTYIKLRYWRDEVEISFNLQVDYAKQPYGLLLKYSERQENKKTSVAEFKFRDKVYSISASLMSEQPKQLTVEIHLDKARDIHLLLRSLSTDTKKEASIEIKWDANRDPTEKLAISAEYNNPKRRAYDGNFLITYPERSFSGNFEFDAASPEYRGVAHIGWSSYESIQIYFNAGSIAEQARDMWISLKLNTPFEGWKSNSISGGWYQLDNLLLANGSMAWADNQNLGLVIMGDYKMHDPILKIEFKIGLNSTIRDVPTASIYLKHFHDNSKLESEIKYKHAPEEELLQTFAIRSVWQKDPQRKHIDGNVFFKTPFDGYKFGSFSTQIAINNNKVLKGAANLDLEMKRFTISVEAYARKFTDVMFVTNITTPIDKFRKIIGRFGINDRDKHFVAEVRTPERALGAELLYSIVSTTDFNVKFNLETPLEAFERVMIIGKYNMETVEFKGGWNKILLGYIGVWRMVSFTDFEYSYKVFTPLENLTETGFVAKYVQKEDILDLELSLKFAKHKLGIVANGRPKLKLLRNLGLQLSDSLTSKLLDETKLFTEFVIDEEETVSNDDIDDDLLNIVGNMELDILIWPTVVGTLDIQERGDSYFATGSIKLPHGDVEIKNIFYYPDVLNMKNSLHISTPFNMSREITSVYIHSIELKKYYIFGMEFGAFNHENWIQVGAGFNYTNSTEEMESRSHDLLIGLLTPLPQIPIIHMKGNIEVEDNIYRGNISAYTQAASLSLGASLEHDENFIDTSFGLSLDTVEVQNYACKVYFKKDLSDIENAVEIGFEIHDSGTLSKLRFETTWHFEDPHYLVCNAKLHTNLIPVSLTELSILYNLVPSPIVSVKFGYTIQDRITELFCKATHKGNDLTVEIKSPFEMFENVSVQGSLNKKSATGYYFMGNIYMNGYVYNVEGPMTIVSSVPIEFQLKVRSLDKNIIGYITYKLTDLEDGYAKVFQLKVLGGDKYKDKYMQIEGGYTFANKINWRVLFSVQFSDWQLPNQQSGKNAIDVKVKVTPDAWGKITGEFEFGCPLRFFGVDEIKVNTDFRVLSTSGEMHATYTLPGTNGSSLCTWTWIPLENMQILVDNVAIKMDGPPKILKAGFKYIKDDIFEVGTVLNVNSIWKLESNGSFLVKSMNEANISMSVLLPPPYSNVHKISAVYNSLYKQIDSNTHVNYEVKYEGELDHMGSRGHYKNTTDLEGLVRFYWGHGNNEDAIEANALMERKGISRKLSARVATPYYIEDTLTVSGSYDINEIFHLFAGRIYYPSSKQVANGDIQFASLANMKGNVNCTTPFKNITWLRGDFDFMTTGTASRRYLKAIWPKDSAFFNLQSSFQSHNLDRDLQGTIKIEVPLATRHYANIDYSLNERPLVTNGQCVIDFNKKRVLNGKYKCKSESSAGYDKDVVDIMLENELKPIGINYIHIIEQKGIDAPIYDMKRAEVFELQKSKAFNITTELHIKTSLTGQDYKIIAIHPNRTVIITSDYDFQENVTKQRSKIQLAQNVWLAYDVKIENHTKSDNESQSFNIQLSYPRRNLTTEGWYSVTDNSFDSDVAFKWTYTKPKDIWEDETETEPTPENKMMRALFQWKNEPTDKPSEINHTASFTIKHPSLEKDISLQGQFYKSPGDIKSNIQIEYCDDTDHVLKFEASAKHLLTVNYRNYSMKIFGEHIASELDLSMLGSIGARPGLYELLSSSKYKRGYLPLQEGSLDGFLNLRASEVYYRKVSPHKTFMVWGKTGENYPIYTVNASYEDSPDVNSTGRFYVNLYDKLIRLNVNMTPDASHHLHMLGYIADARNAFFDLYRDYDDIRVVDIAYYLRMNHSRLVTSQLIWRPKMKSEIKAKIKQSATDFYDSISENIDFWVKTTYTETVDTVNDVWINAKPHIQVFLDDIGGLNIIEEDIKEFKTFLNQSYEANDFYVKTVVNFTMTVLDELAIRNHIDSVPKILNEIWQALGESGQALHQNIVRLIETIKISYKKAVEFIGKIFHGEALENFSGLMEKAITKYDKFMKDLHISLIKYVENAWTRLTDSLMSYWKKFLQRIEPSIFKMAQYLETVLWNISKEIFDFLYKRTNEIVDSPYFNTVANFTQDLDRLYNDIMSNDALTNIKKYTDLTLEFLQEEYFKIVPFGKEMHDVITEVLQEIKTLQNLEPIQFVIYRINEIKAKLEWLADEFQLENRIQKLWEIVKKKIARLTAQTALEMDDKYREAKTKFIFDPDIGVIELEQKLPMSWHAFNETPRFEEIPEYKMIADVQAVFAASNYSFWNFYYDIKPYLDLNLWLPPFKSSSFLYGSRHFMTFDKRFVSLNSKYLVLDSNLKPNQCSYLLAHDYVDSNFTVVIEPSTTKYENELVASKNLAVLLDGKVVQINIIGSSIRIGNTQSVTLPIRIGDSIIYRDSNVLIIDSSKGFQLTCNIQFDLCWFELSGWYFGKTSGILGNMNNEKYDDYQTPARIQSNNDQVFVDSWSFKNCTQESTQIEQNATTEVIGVCDGLFKSKISNFANCFGVVDPMPFYEICLDLGMNSISSIVNHTTIHPFHEGTCTAAVSYIETCALERTPLRIPSSCIHCELANGTYVPEGKFIKFTGNDVPQTTDVVFIVEAKPCNHNFTVTKSMIGIINSLEKEFNEANVTNNRYAVIAFGGAAPFDKPRSVVYKNEIFTNYMNVKHFFEHIEMSDSNSSDIFEAISVAFKLIFRPGSSKTFILLPCSRCNASSMKLDYSSVLQVLLEEGINLHILMDQEFSLDKKRIEKMLFGLDKENAFTKKYLKDNKGDKELKKQVRLPKTSLGLCAPLALESNGTVFTTRKLRPGGRHPIKKVATVFAKRVAVTAKPSRCQLCECSGHNSGTAYMACTHCHFPNPTSLDYGYNEEEMLSIMQTDTDFSWEWNDDEEI